MVLRVKAKEHGVAYLGILVTFVRYASGKRSELTTEEGEYVNSPLGPPTVISIVCWA